MDVAFGAAESSNATSEAAFQNLSTLRSAYLSFSPQSVVTIPKAGRLNPVRLVVS